MYSDNQYYNLTRLYENVISKLRLEKRRVHLANKGYGCHTRSGIVYTTFSGV